METFLSKSPAETQQMGEKFAKKLVQGGHGGPPLLVGLGGDLGAGKTTFVQGMARGMGINPRYYVSSPTFTLINEYANLIHVDLYRIKKALEGETLGLEEYFLPGKVIVIEWVERMPHLEKELDFRVVFETISEKEREIRIEALRETAHGL